YEAVVDGALQAEARRARVRLGRLLEQPLGGVAGVPSSSSPPVLASPPELGGTEGGPASRVPPTFLQRREGMAIVRPTRREEGRMAEREAWAQRWRALSEQVLGEMQAWRAAHPRATLAEIEAEAEARVVRLRARLVEDTALASPMRDWTEHAGGER